MNFESSKAIIGKRLKMTEQRAWEIIGISPSKDPKEIKRAYARQCRRFHPEEQPEKYQELRQAYEWLLAFLSGTETFENNAALEDGEGLTQLPFTKKQQEPLASSEKPSENAAQDNSGLAQGKIEEIVQEELLEEQRKMQGLLSQMKGLDRAASPQMPADLDDLEAMLKRWDLLADSTLFLQYGTTQEFYQILLAWLIEIREHRKPATVTGLYRIYHFATTSAKEIRTIDGLREVYDELCHHIMRFRKEILTYGERQITQVQEDLSGVFAQSTSQNQENTEKETQSIAVLIRWVVKVLIAIVLIWRIIQSV